jgi:hypothetical protein
MSFLYETGDYGIWSFLVLTVFLGGVAALATGRALALTWRPLWQCILYSGPLALAIAFLHFALFEEPVIPLQIMIEDATDAASLGGKLSAIAWHLRGWVVEFLMLALLALIGYRLTRVRQMATQYRFAYTANGPLHWRKTG